MSARSLCGLTAVTLALIAGAPGLSRADVEIDFSGFADGTHVVSANGIVFSLHGGQNDAGLATIADGGLTNSTSGAYPTANILEFTFAGPVSNVSFVFDNFGSGVPGGFGESYYQAFGPGGVLLATGSLNGASGQTFNVAASGITDLQFNNNSGGTSSWLFGVVSIRFQPDVVATPEPSTLASAGVAGVMLVGGWVWRRGKAAA